MIAAMIALAGFTTLTTERFTGIADNLYDNAFIGVHYAHKAEVGFVRFEDSHLTVQPPYRSDGDRDAIQQILNDLDVAIERAPTAREKQLAVSVRAQVSGLTDGSHGARDVKAIDHAVTRLVQRFADRALDLRTSADDLLSRLKQLL